MRLTKKRRRAILDAADYGEPYKPFTPLEELASLLEVRDHRRRRGESPGSIEKAIRAARAELRRR